MSKTYDRLENKHIDFISRQKMFFVATAPSSKGGHVNVLAEGI